MDKMYVIVAENISKKWYIPQSCHAVAQYSIEHRKAFEYWGNGSIVVLGAKDRNVLNSCIEILNEMNIKYSKFKEPFIHNLSTSIAFISPEQIKAFNTLNLLA